MYLRCKSFLENQCQTSFKKQRDKRYFKQLHDSIDFLQHKLRIPITRCLYFFLETLISLTRIQFENKNLLHSQANNVCTRDNRNLQRRKTVEFTVSWVLRLTELTKNRTRGICSINFSEKPRSQVCDEEAETNRASAVYMHASPLNCN